MPIDYQASGRVHLSFLILAPVGLALMAAISAGYGALLGINPWGIANPLATIAVAFALVPVSLATLRLGKVRHLGAGMGFALLAIGVTFGATTMGTMEATSYQGSFSAFFGERRETGVPLFGSFRVAGFPLVLVWILHWAFLGIALFISSGQATKPFCELCSSWASRARWKMDLIGPSPGALAAVKELKTVQSLKNVSGGGDRSKRLHVSLKCCKCARVASLSVGVGKSNPDEKQMDAWLMESVVISRNEAESVVRWAQHVAPATPPLPAMQIADPSTEPLELVEIRAPLPDDEPVSLWRWDGTWLFGTSSVDIPFTAEVRKHLKKGAIGAVYSALSMARTNHERAYFAEACADWAQRPGWLDQWELRDADAPELHLIRGIFGVKWAWIARGGSWKPKNYDVFQLRLHDAFEDLVRAAEQLPDDPTPLAWQIYCAKGLGFDVQATADILRRVIKLDPQHRPAHSFFLDFIAPKWHGSDDKRFSFARKAVAGSPPGSVMHVLICEAHLDAAAFGEGSPGGDEGVRSYLSRPEVAEEIRAANARCFGGSHRASIETPRTRAYFAYTLWKAGLHEEAAQHLRVIGKSSPWMPFSRNLPGYKHSVSRARRECRVR